MADQALQCSVITPEGRVFEGPVESVVIPAHDGELGILRGHAPLVCKLGAGRLRAKTDNVEERWFVDGGFCQVFENQVTVLHPSGRFGRSRSIARRPRPNWPRP